MCPPWTPEFALPRESASRLIAEQFPELAPSLARTPLEPVGSGWDNDAYRLGTDWLFRFPRRALAVTCIENETRWLPTLARALPLPVPEPRWIGRPGESYPHPFLGSRWIEGRTACSVDLSEADRGAIAVPLGRFLARLHAMPVPDGAPEDPAGRKDVPTLAAKALEWIGKIERECGEAAAAMRAVERLAGTPEPAGPERWVHGDLYARHLLVDGRRRLAGVIDWGDVHAGDPADDLSIGWSFLPEESRAEFLEAYGEVDRGTQERARLYALRVGAVIAAFGREVDDRALWEAGRNALRFASA